MISRSIIGVVKGDTRSLDLGIEYELVSTLGLGVKGLGSGV